MTIESKNRVTVQKFYIFLKTGEKKLQFKYNFFKNRKLQDEGNGEYGSLCKRK